MAVVQWLEGAPVNELPYVMRRNQHKIGRAGRASEQRLARELQGRARPASGAMDGAKGDIDLGKFLMEAKSSTQLSMALKFPWLLKIVGEARAEGKKPCLAVSFVDEQGRPHMDGDWVLVQRHVFEELI
jgi:hypothetical protein